MAIDFRFQSENGITKKVNKLKISAHCNVTNCLSSGYPCLESISSFADFCDEVIVVDGGTTDGSLEKIKQIPNVRIIQGEKWERDFNWDIIPRNLQIGYEACKNDWAFHFDVDYIFHEDDVEVLKKEIVNAYLPAIMLRKVNYVLTTEKFRKDSFPLLVYKKEFKAIGYGMGVDNDNRISATFLRPIVKEKKRDDGLWQGKSIMKFTTRLHYSDIPFYTYDFTFMTEKQVREQKVRFENAISRFRGGEVISEEKAFNGFINMMKKRHKECLDNGIIHVGLDKHSKFIRDKVKNIKPNQFGFNGFGKL